MGSFLRLLLGLSSWSGLVDFLVHGLLFRSCGMNKQLQWPDVDRWLFVFVGEKKVAEKGWEKKVRTRELGSERDCRLYLPPFSYTNLWLSIKKNWGKRGRVVQVLFFDRDVGIERSRRQTLIWWASLLEFLLLFLYFLHLIPNKPKKLTKLVPTSQCKNC